MSVLDRQELRRRLLARRGLGDTTPARAGGIPRRPAGERIPLSHAQERMWFFHQVDPAASAYNVCVLWRITGPLDRAALRGAFDRLVARHEVLRTVYPVAADGVPYQEIRATLPVDWSEVDLTARAGDPAGQERALGELARAAGRAPFDLATRSPLRLVLVRLDTERHALVMIGQHITWDGTAFGVFSRELGTAYADLVAGRPDTLPPLPLQYADFASWHRRRWRDAPDERELAYWRDRFSPLPEPVDIPTDRARPAIVDEEGGWCVRHLTADLTAGLTALATAERATPFMALIAGIATLLGRYAQAEDVTIGTVTQNRDQAELDRLIGNFGNTIALRVDLSGRPSFRTLLRRVRDTCAGAYAHADAPFDRLLDELAVERRLDRSPLFDVTVIFLAQDMAGPVLPGLEVTWEKIHNGTAQTDLSFDALLSGDRLGVQATYRSALFRDRTVHNLLSRLDGLLAQAVADPDRRIDTLDLLLAPERDLVLGGRADRTRPLPAGPQTVPALFEAQVARSASRPAVVSGDRSLTFAELNAAANRLARLLVSHGIGPEDRVAVSLPRSADVLVAILAVLKAGAAYLPLDPHYPAEHVARVLADAGPAALIGSGSGAPVVIDPAAPELASLPDRNLTDAERTAPLRPDHPAFVIYTSGSTGRPKGVITLHRGLVNLFHSHRDELYAEARRRTGRAHLRVGHAWSFSFDASWQPQLWLLDGHAVHVLPYETYADPRQLAAEITERKFDFIELTPGLLDETLRWLCPGDGPAGHLPAVLGFGGEAVSPALWERLGGLPDTAAFNLYGPTEATVDSLVARAVPGEGPIVGHPVAGARVTVLDAALAPVPPGVPGELYLSGAGLARGYLGQPGLTAARFVADRYGPPGSRAYRTGDLVRWRADGELEFLGRRDDQAKIRGFRVEPAEVEAALRRVAGDRPVAVAVREDRPGVRRLIGYVVAAPTDPVDGAELRARLTGALPDHLVPSAVVVLAEFPLMPNGKLDRRALPAPAPAGSGRRPEDPVQETLCRLVADLLGVPGVGIDDSFFDLGGDSILAIQLVSRARAAGLTLRPRDVFTHRIVARIAAAVVPHEAAPPAPDDGTGEVPATPIMCWLAASGIPLARFHQTTVLAVPPDLDPARLTAALTAVIEHHDILRARLVHRPDGGWSLVVPPAGTPVPGDLLRRVAATESAAAVAAAVRRLDPEAGAMVRAVWCDPGPDRTGRLVLVAHHLVVDAVSWGILVADLADAWRAVRAGERPVLPPVGTSFRRWALEQRERAGAPERVADADAWRAWLGAGVASGIAARRLDPERDTLGGAGLNTLRLSERVTAELLERLPELYRATVDDVLLAVLAVAVADWRAARGGHAGALLVDVERHGRNESGSDVDLSRTVGWFTATAPERVDVGTVDRAALLRADPEVGRVLGIVKEQRRATPGCAEAYGIVRWLNPATAAVLGGLPAAEVGFNYLGRWPAGEPTGEPEYWAPVPDLAAVRAGLDPATPFTHPLEITALTEGGRLAVHWSWPGDLFGADEVHDLVQRWRQTAEAFARHARRPEAGGHTPSDFPLVPMDQARLNRVLAGLPAVADLWPATPAQEVMLATRCRTPDAHHTHVAFTLPAPFDPAALRTAAAALLRRYPNLRAGFRTEHGWPVVQFVPERVTLHWRDVDLSGSAPAERERELERLTAEDRQRRFDPAIPPLLRFTAVRLGDGAGRLLIASHHLLLDGWSVPIVLGELLGRRRDGAPPAYRELLERRHPSGAWAALLAGVDAPTAVGTGRPGSRPVDREITAPGTLAEVARARGVTLSALFRAAWARVLGAVTGRDDVVFGATVAGRPADLPGVESMVGLFIETVPVRLRPHEDPVAAAHAQQVRLADEPGPPAELLLAGHFDTLLVVESFPGDGYPPAREVAWSDSTHHPLAVFVYPGDPIRIRLTHRPGAVAASTMDRIVAELTAVLGEFSR